MYGFQQAPVPGGPWPRFDASTYNVAVDYSAPAMRLETARWHPLIRSLGIALE